MYVRDETIRYWSCDCHLTTEWISLAGSTIPSYGITKNNQSKGVKV